jgi:hypothetical protein
MPTLRFRAALPAAGLLGLHLTAGAALAQQVDLPRPSPKASVSQTVGITEVTLRYSSPGVKGRKIWGELVPYGQVWRTGANENTTITFSTAVRIAGTELPAGTYGLQTLPAEGDWTVILSKGTDPTAPFSYKEENDALRFKVKPETTADSRERLAFSFEDTTDTASTVVLRWEKLRLPFTLTVDTPALVLSKAKEAIRWQAPMQAANYCVQNDTCLDEAARWIDASIALQETFANLRAKAMLLAKRNDPKSAVTYGEKALMVAKSAQPAPNATQVKELEELVASWKKGL